MSLYPKHASLPVAELERQLGTPEEATPPSCDKPVPSWFPGQPFEWHLGHGCALDVSEAP